MVGHAKIKIYWLVCYIIKKRFCWIFPILCAVSLVLTLLRSRLLLLQLLDKQVKHLRLDELLDKMSSGLGLNGLVETSFFKHPLLSSMPALHIRGIMADCFYKEVQEGF